MKKEGQEMKDEFKNLYKSVAGASPLFREQLTKPMKIPYLTSFTAVEGNRYSGRKEDDIRFMLVGRAANGWTEKRNYGDMLTVEEFVNSSMANLNTEKSTVTANGSDRFECIGKPAAPGEAPRSRYREGIDVPGLAMTTEPYSLSAPIWNYPKSIWCRLTGNDAGSAWEERWFENIVWSNLYKIAPTLGGNPSEKLKKTEFEACAALLLAEIEQFKPTHILFATGYDGWFDEFDRRYNKNSGDSDYYCLLDAKYKNRDTYVEARGTLMGVRFVVSKRPETEPEEPFVNAVVKAYGK